MGINIGGDDVREVTIDGNVVNEITMDGDVVYVAGPSQFYLPRSDGTDSSAALSTIDGSVVWSVGTGDTEQDGTYAVSGNTVFEADRGGTTVRALDTSDGSEVWSNSSFGDIASGNTTVYNGNLYVPDQSDDTLYALDVTDGSEVQTYSMAGEPYWSHPTVLDGTLYMHTGSGLHAFDESTGTEQWIDTRAAGGDQTPIVVNANGTDPVVYVSDYSALFCIDGTNGDVIWERNFADSAMSAAVVNSTVYEFSDNHSSAASGYALVALDAADGTEQWYVDMEGEWLASMVAVVNGTVYAMASETLFALAESDGTEQWRYSFPSGFEGWQNHPTVVDGAVYVGAYDSTDNTVGEVVALDVSDGSVLWQTSYALYNSSPAFAEDVSWQFSQRNGLMSADITTGTWSNTSSVTSDSADADGSQTNEWTVSITHDGNAIVGGDVTVASGYDESSLGGIAAGDTVATDSNGDAVFTATASSAGDYTLGFSHAMTSVQTATATYQEPITVKEDWESIGGGSESLDDNYFQEPTQFPSAGPGTYWEVQDTKVFEGSWTLHGMNSNERIGAASGTGRDTSNGTEYLTHLSCNSGGWATVLFHIQDPDVPLDGGCFYGVVNQADGWIRSGGMDTSGNYLNLNETNVTISADTEYILGCEATSSGVTVTLYDTSMSQLATVTASNTNFTSGTIGFWTRNADTYYDYTHHQ